MQYIISSSMARCFANGKSMFFRPFKIQICHSKRDCTTNYNRLNSVFPNSPISIILLMHIAKACNFTQHYFSRALNTTHFYVIMPPHHYQLNRHNIRPSSEHRGAVNYIETTTLMSLLWGGMFLQEGGQHIRPGSI